MVRFTLVSLAIVSIFNNSVIVLGQGSQTFSQIVNSDATLLGTSQSIAVSQLSYPPNGSTFLALTNNAFGAFTRYSFIIPPIFSISVLYQPNYMAHLQNFMLLHMVQSKAILTDQMADGDKEIAINGETITISIVNGTIILMGVTIAGLPLSTIGTGTSRNISSSDGVMHRIEGAPLWPLFATRTVAQYLSNVSDVSIFNELFVSTGLNDLSKFNNVTLTLFVPNNDAFNKDVALLNFIRSNVNAARLFISGHIITTRVIPTQRMTTGQLLTLASTTIDVIVNGGSITVNAQTLVRSNQLANNGLFHVVDTVFNVPGVAVPVPVPVPVPLPPVPVLPTAPVPVPLPVAPVPVPLPVAPVPVPIPVPVPVPVPVPIPVLIPMLVPVPLPITLPVTTMKTPLKVPTSAPIAVPIPLPVPVRILTPAPVTLPVATTTKAPTKVPTSAPLKPDCGLFGLNFICLFNGCGFFARLLNLRNC